MISAAAAFAHSRRDKPKPLTLGAGMRLEELLTSKQGFGIETATAVQRAFCRVADGLPLAELVGHPDVITALGGPQIPPEERPRLLGLFSGVRTGKSQIASALAIRATQVVDLSKLSAGEVPRVSVISLNTDKARPVLDHIEGNIEASASLKTLLVGEPTADTVTLRHPSGRPVEIKVVAATKAGGSVVSRWSAGVILDEAPRMVGAEDGVVNMDDIVAGSLPRLLPGAQLFALGSPWAPWGPAYKLVMTHWGKPSKRVVVFWCAAPLLNPVWWTPERIAEIKETPSSYITDVEARFHEQIETTAIAPELIDDRLRADEQTPYDKRYHYSAAIDPATRGNAWTLLVGHRDQRGERHVDLAREWIGTPTAPLSPRAVLGEIASIVRPYGIDTLHGDQWSADALLDIASEFKLNLCSHNVSMPDKVNAVDNLRSWCVDKTVSFPNVPGFVSDLKRIRRKITQQGVTIELPKTPDGRHCDYAAGALVLLTVPMVEAEKEPEKKPTDADYEAWKMEKAELDAWEREQGNDAYEL